MNDQPAWRIDRDGAPFAVDESLGFVVNHLARRLAAALGEGLAPLGLTVGAFPVMLALWAEDGRAQREVAHALGLDETTLVRTLDRMARDGLVERRRDAEDRRRTRVYLTARGAALKEPALAVAEGVNARALAAMDPARVAEVRRLLWGMVTALEQSGP